MTPPYTAVHVEPTEALPYDGDITDQSLPTTSLLQGNTDRLAQVSLRYLMERWHYYFVI